jgi:starch synthase (maltosyl-transferring)
VNQALDGREEYADSEKYEIRNWDRGSPQSLREIITLVNAARRENPALHSTWNVEFLDVDNDNLLAYAKASPDSWNVVLVIVNLDPHHTQGGWVNVPVDRLGIDPSQPYLVHDLIGDDKYVWHGSRNFVQLNPAVLPVHLLRVNRRLRREVDFDYYL